MTWNSPAPASVRPVMRPARRCLATVFAVVVALPALASPAPARPESPCPAGALLIVVEHVESGFAGRTGERTSLGEDGCYSVDALFNDKAGHLRSGHLGPEPMAALRAALAAADLPSLPETAGAAPKINPATLSVTCRGVTRTVVAPAGTAIKDMTADGNGALAGLGGLVVDFTAPAPAP